MKIQTIIKKGNLIRLVSIFVTLSVTCVLLSGCFGSSSTNKKLELADEVIFPLEEPVTLTYWGSVPANALPILNDHTDTAWYKGLEKQTGVIIDFIHPVSGQEREQLNIMLASRDLPDMIEGTFNNYSGGVIKAHSDGLIIDIKDLQEKYAPNLMKIYENYPDVLLDVETEKGEYLRAPFIRGHDKLRSFRGLAVRRDWLKELNLEIPTTIDDWYKMLTAFKEKKKISVPLLVQTTNLKNYGLITAYGIAHDYFMEDGKLVYGAVDPRYKEYLTTMKKWYEEGLIYSEFALGSNTKANDALVTNGQVGSMVAVAGGGIGKYMNLMSDIDPKFDLVGVPYPSLVKGEPAKFMHQDPIVHHNGSVSITSACKRPEIAMAWLDYGYTPEGNKILNFGIEGESYNMVDGYPKYTDLIMKNPEGLPVATIGHKYSRSFSQGPFVQDERYLEQYLDLPQQKESIEAWIKYADAVNEANTRVYGELTPDESSQVLPKQVEIDTYVDEMLLKFIMGKESLDNFDQYVSRVKQMGLDDIMKTKQSAHNRFVEKFPQAKTVRSINVIDFYKAQEKK